MTPARQKTYLIKEMLSPSDGVLNDARIHIGLKCEAEKGLIFRLYRPRHFVLGLFSIVLEGSRELSGRYSDLRLPIDRM